MTNDYYNKLMDELPEYKVRILVKATGRPVNGKWYNGLGASIWLSRIARSHGYKPDELMISEACEMTIK